MEAPPAPEHDRGGERADHPFPAVELRCGHHRQHHDRDPEHDRNDPSTPEICFASSFGCVVVGGDRSFVAESFHDRPHVELVGAVVQDGRSTVGEVHAHLVDAVELAQPTLDAVRAGCAGHPFDGDVGAQGAAGSSQVGGGHVGGGHVRSIT